MMSTKSMEGGEGQATWVGHACCGANRQSRGKRRPRVVARTEQTFAKPGQDATTPRGMPRSERRASKRDQGKVSSEATLVELQPSDS